MRDATVRGVAMIGIMVWAATAMAELCPKCRDKMFISNVGKCVECKGETASGALKLCKACSAKLRECENCRAKLDPGAEAKSGKNPPADVRPQPGAGETGEVSELIAQLNHERLAVRETATKKLADMGEKIYGLLKETLKRKDLDPETAYRIRSVLGAEGKDGKSVTDKAAGITVTLGEDGTTLIATDSRGAMQWRTTIGQRGVSLAIDKGVLLVKPVNIRIDLRTGKVLSIERTVDGLMK